MAFGSVQPWAFTTAEVVIGLLILIWFIKILVQGELSVVRLSFFFPAIFFIGVILLQIVPFPASVLSFISPSTDALYNWTFLGFHIPEIEFQDWSFNALFAHGRTISVYPHATRVELSKYVFYLGFFLVVVNNIHNRKDVIFLLSVLIFFGFVFSLFAIVQNFSWNGKAFWFISLQPNRIPFGPFINKNHFAGYIEMIVPLAIGLTLSGRKSTESAFTDSSIHAKKILNKVVSDQGKYILIIFSTGIMILALFLSRSRGGMTSFAVSMAVFVFCLWKKKSGGGKFLVLIGSIIVPVFIFSLWMDYLQVSGQLISLLSTIKEGMSNEVRFKVWNNALLIIKDYPVFGVGLGGWGLIYPLYQKIATGHYFSHLENDYEQIFVEAGTIGALVAILGAVMFSVYVLKRFMDLRDRRMVLLSAGGIASCTAIAVHSAVDFNLHIPSNAFHFTLVMALLVVIVNLRGGERKPYLIYSYFKFRLTRTRRILWAILIIVIGIFFSAILSENLKAQDKIYFENGQKDAKRMAIYLKINSKKAEFYGRASIRNLHMAIRLNPLNYSYRIYTGMVAATLHFFYSSMVDEQIRPFNPYLDYEKYFRGAMKLYPLSGKIHYNIGLYYLLNWKVLSENERTIGGKIFVKAFELTEPNGERDHMRKMAVKKLQVALGNGLNSEIHSLLTKILRCYKESRRIPC